MEVTRLISVFDKRTENLLEEINIDHISLEILQDIFKPEIDDPFMIKVYSITAKELKILNDSLNPKIVYNLDKNIYQLDCFKPEP